MLALAVIAVIADDATAAVADVDRLRSVHAPKDVRVSAGGVLLFRAERVRAAQRFRSIATSVRITDEFDQSRLRGRGLQEGSVSGEFADGHGSLLTLCALLKDDGVLSDFLDFGGKESDERISGHLDYFVLDGFLLAVDPEVEIIFLGGRTSHHESFALEFQFEGGRAPVETHRAVFRDFSASDISYFRV